MTLKKTSLILLLCLCALLLFSACQGAKPDLDQKQADVAVLMDSVIANDQNAAVALMEHVPIASQAQLDAFWNELLRIYDGASTYKIKFISWNTTYSFTDQSSLTTVVYQAKADTKACAEFTLTYDGEDLLRGINVTDVTERSSPVIIIVRVLLILGFAASLALCIWMTVDCVKRPIRFKVLWIILIWVSVILQVSMIGTSFRFNFSFTVIPTWGSLLATVSSFLLRIPVPVGALIYRAVRKKIKRKASKLSTEVPAEPTTDDLVSTLIDQPEATAPPAPADEEAASQEDTQESQSDEQTEE